MIIAIYTSSSRVHRMSRTGRAKRDGGDGVKWACTCGCDAKRKPCYPLLMIFGTGFMNRTAVKRMKITKDGKKHVKRFRLIREAVPALAESGE